MSEVSDKKKERGERTSLKKKKRWLVKEQEYNGKITSENLNTLNKKITQLTLGLV